MKKNYFIDTVNVIIDGLQQQIVTITGMGYDPNIVKQKAIEIVRQEKNTSQLSAVIIEHTNVTLKEYQSITGHNPPWLGH